jgi:hypothetical protein
VLPDPAGHPRTFALVARLGSTVGFALSLSALVLLQALTHVIPVTATGYRVASPLYYLPYSRAAAASSAAARSGSPAASATRST